MFLNFSFKLAVLASGFLHGCDSFQSSNVILSIFKNIVKPFPLSIFFLLLSNELSIFRVQINFFGKNVPWVRHIDYFWEAILPLENDIAVYSHYPFFKPNSNKHHSSVLLEYYKNLFFIKRSIFSRAFEQSVSSLRLFLRSIFSSDFFPPFCILLDFFRSRKIAGFSIFFGIYAFTPYFFRNQVILYTLRHIHVVVAFLSFDLVSKIVFLVSKLFSDLKRNFLNS